MISLFILKKRYHFLTKHSTFFPLRLFIMDTKNKRAFPLRARCGSAGEEETGGIFVRRERTAASQGGQSVRGGRVRKKSAQREGALHLMAMCGVVWMFVFCYLPLAGLYIAFSDYKISGGLFDGEFVGLKYFEDILTDSKIPQVLLNTLGISFLNLTIGFVVPIVFALLLSELPSRRYKSLVQTVSYLPHFISWVILGGILISWCGENGFLNVLLQQLGLTSEPIYLLGYPEYFWGTAVGTNIWKETGWNAIIYIAALSGLNQELYEAASVEGAGRFQKIWHISLPGIKGTIAILFILQVANIFISNFDQIFVLQNNLNDSRSTVLDIYTYRLGIAQGRYSYSAAVGLLKSVVALVLLLITNKVSDKLTESAIL